MKKYLIYVFVFTGASVFAQTHYKITLIQAAPGSLEALINQMKIELEEYHKISNEEAYLLRHTQGDVWDLMLIAPIGSLSEYYNSNLKEILEHPFGSHYYDLMKTHIDAFTFGPNLSVLKEYFENNDFFHVEMFVSLPGKQEKLRKEREMENVYLKETGRNPNLIFLKFNGFKWDIFTIGAYKNIKEFAKGSSLAKKAQDSAAKKAGFGSADDMGFYLRKLIDEHNDTLAEKVSLK